MLLKYYFENEHVGNPNGEQKFDESKKENACNHELSEVDTRMLMMTYAQVVKKNSNEIN